jgi:putative hemolysin
MFELVILFFLILLNAFIVMCEMALVSAKKNRLETSANKGDKKAEIVLKLKENPEIFLSTTQIYITLISILTGVYSGERFSIYLQPLIEKISLLEAYAAPIATTLIVIIVTFLSILFGELIPKSLLFLLNR